MFQINRGEADFDVLLPGNASRLACGTSVPRASGSNDREMFVDADRIASLRVSGASSRTISEELAVGIGTLYKSVKRRSKKVSPAASAGS